MEGNQDNQEQQKQRKSSIDRVNDLANKAQSARKNYKRARTALTAIKAARAGATVMQGAGALGGSAAVEGAVATSPIWGTAVAIILLILLLIALFIIVFVGGAQQGANPGAGEPPVDSSNVCTGQCREACLPDESDLGMNTIPCGADLTYNHCCLPAGALPPLHFYCQYGAVNAAGTLVSRHSWDYSTPSGTCNLYSTGCGPTSVAMILTSFGDTLTPSQVSLQSGYQGCFGASPVNSSFIKGQGFIMTGNITPAGSSINLITINNYLTRGYYILAGANIHVVWSSGLHTTSYTPHAFVITGVDLTNSTVTIYDPTACVGGYANGIRVLRNVNTYGGDLNGWLFTYAIKK